jgi:hypothetical protein
LIEKLDQEANQLLAKRAASPTARDVSTWLSQVESPETTNAPETLVPGVVLRYDVPVLRRP